MTLVLRSFFTRLKETNGDRKFVFTPPPAPTAPPIPTPTPAPDPIRDPGVEITVQLVAGPSPFTVGSAADLQWVNIRDVQAEPNAWAMVKVRVFNSGNTGFNVNLGQILFGGSLTLDAASVLGSPITPIVALNGVTAITIPDDSVTLDLTGAPTNYLTGTQVSIATDIVDALYTNASTHPQGIQLTLGAANQDQFVLVFFVDQTGNLGIEPDLVTAINNYPGGAIAQLLTGQGLTGDNLADNESYTGTPVLFSENILSLNVFAGVSNTDYVNTGPSVVGDAVFSFNYTQTQPIRQKIRLRLFQLVPIPTFPYSFVGCWARIFSSNILDGFWVGTDYTGVADTRTKYDNYSNGSTHTNPQPGTVVFLNAMMSALFSEKGYLEFEAGYLADIGIVIATETPFAQVAGDHMWRLLATTWTPDDGYSATADFDNRQQ
jgi:hypothetical protein